MVKKDNTDKISSKFSALITTTSADYTFTNFNLGKYIFRCHEMVVHL